MQSIQVTDPKTGRIAIALVDEQNQDRNESARLARNEKYKKYWQYYEGKQYDKENDTIIRALGITTGRIPEHERLHAYSGVIEEGIDFITDQLVEDLTIEVKSDKEIQSGEIDEEVPEEQKVFLNIWEQSDMDLNAPDLTREALVSGESFVHLAWDEAEKIVRIIPYDAASVDPVYSQDDYKRMISCTIYSRYFSEELNREIEIREVYTLGQTSEGFEECVYLRYVDKSEEPTDARILNIPFIPVVHLITIRKRVRESSGDSLVERLTGDADRYNSINHLEFLIARYNSNSHMCIFGDETNINPSQINLGGEANDFWVFPASTDVKPMTLPTDITMINNQKETIENQMFRKMGLQRMNIQDFKGLGAPSGYALSIINRKTEGVFNRIQKELQKGYNQIFDKTMDMQAIMESGKPWYTIDPQKTYPNRTIEFTFGSMFVADRNEIRADFTAGLVSQKKSLMLLGYSEQDANEIMDQQAEEIEAKSAVEMEGMAGLIRGAKTSGDKFLTQPEKA